MAPKENGHPVDRHVGAQIRLRRRSLGMSQSVLADRVGLTFQQIQKYERGANRVSASMLYEIAKALDAPLGDFFEGLPPTAGDAAGSSSLDRFAALHRLMETKDGQATAELFSQIGARLQRVVADLVRALAEER
jgi:transcriptional regulator with XRE-family HTH domain